MLADDVFAPLAARLPPQGLAVSSFILGPANPIGPVDHLAQERFAGLQGQYHHVVGVHVEEIEDIEIRRMLLHPPLDLASVCEVEALLQRPEAGAAVLVQTDHFAIEDDEPRETVPQRSDDVRELKVL